MDTTQSAETSIARSACPVCAGPYALDIDECGRCGASGHLLAHGTFREAGERVRRFLAAKGAQYEGRRGNWVQVYSGGRFYPLDPQPEDVHLIDIAHALANECRFGGHCREFYSVAQHSVLVAALVQETLRHPRCSFCTKGHDDYRGPATGLRLVMSAEWFDGKVGAPWVTCLAAQGRPAREAPLGTHVDYHLEDIAGLALRALLHDAAEAYTKDIPRPLKREAEMGAYCEAQDEVQRAIEQRFGVQARTDDADDAVVKKLMRWADDTLLVTEMRDLMAPLDPEWVSSCRPLKEAVVPWSPKDAKRAFLAMYRELAPKGSDE